MAIFADKSDEPLTKAAIEAGVSAYVVDDIRPERLRPVIETAIARFNMFRRMREELAETKRALEERKLIDRAKVGASSGRAVRMTKDMDAQLRWFV